MKNVKSRIHEGIHIMKTLVFSLAIVGLLSACAGKPIRLPLQPVSEPPVGQEHTTHLGDRMLMQSIGYYTDILRVKTIDAFGVYIQEGDFCQVPGSNTYVSFSSRAVGLKNAFGMVIDHTNRLTYKPDSHEICASGTFTLCYDTSDGQFEHLKDRLCSDPDSFQQIIEYNGRSGDVLHFTYREFTHDRMRTPYTTNFNMDYSKGDTITYKGERLRIIEATNEKIKYMVLMNFNDAAI